MDVLPPESERLRGRPLSSTAATIVHDAHGRLHAVLGGSGGSRIFPSIAQVLLHLEAGLTLSEAVEHNRYHNQIVPPLTTIEVGQRASRRIFSRRSARRGDKVGVFDINVGVAKVSLVVTRRSLWKDSEADAFRSSGNPGAERHDLATSDSRKNGVAAGILESWACIITSSHHSSCGFSLLVSGPDPWMGSIPTSATAVKARVGSIAPSLVVLVRRCFCSSRRAMAGAGTRAEALTRVSINACMHRVGGIPCPIRRQKKKKSCAEAPQPQTNARASVSADDRVVVSGNCLPSAGRPLSSPQSALGHGRGSALVRAQSRPECLRSCDWSNT